MHIAFINPHGNFDPVDSYWTEHPDFSGQLVYVKEAAIAMAKSGHQVDILTRQIIDPNWPEFAAPLDRYPGVQNLNIVRIPCGPKKFLPRDELWPYIGTDWVRNIQAFYASTGTIPDVFSAHYGNGGVAAVLLAMATGRAYSFTAHSFGRPAHSQQSLEAICVQAERISVNHAGKVITLTQQERGMRYNQPAYTGAIDVDDSSRFSVIPPGVNRELFSPERTSLDLVIRDRIKAARKRDIMKGRRKLSVVLLASRLAPIKNHLGAVKAFAYSRNLREHANLAIAVRNVDDPLHDFSELPGDEKAVMERIVAEIEAEDLWGCVTAFPLNNQNELAAAYRILAKRQSVCALPAFFEQFGLGPLEAMSTGLPVVATKVGGAVESLVDDGKPYGILVDPASSEDIADGLLQLITDKRLWKKYQRDGIQRVQNEYTWARTAKSYLNVLSELAKEGYQGGELEIPPRFTEPYGKHGHWEM